MLKNLNAQAGEPPARHLRQGPAASNQRGKAKVEPLFSGTGARESGTSKEPGAWIFPVRSRGSFATIVLGQVRDLALPPDLLLLALDACQRLLELLETDELRQVAVWKLVPKEISNQCDWLLTLLLDRLPAALPCRQSRTRSTP